MWWCFIDRWCWLSFCVHFWHLIVSSSMVFCVVVFFLQVKPEKYSLLWEWCDQLSHQLDFFSEKCWKINLAPPKIQVSEHVQLSWVSRQRRRQLQLFLIRKCWPVRESPPPSEKYMHNTTQAHNWVKSSSFCFYSSVSDVWSLGVILFMLVVGEAPFQEANDSETLTMILDCKYRIPPGVSEECRA